MKKIQPFNIWVSGKTEVAQWLNAYVVNDNLSTQAQFYWSLNAAGDSDDTNGQILSQGNLTMSGEDYINWNTEADINDAAYVWIASQLGVTLI